MADQFRFSPAERETFRSDLATTLFIQEGMMTATGVTPTHGPVRERSVNGAANQMLTLVENMINNRGKTPKS